MKWIWKGEDWKLKFAILPITVNNLRIWLEFYEERTLYEPERGYEIQRRLRNEKAYRGRMTKEEMEEIVYKEQNKTLWKIFWVFTLLAIVFGLLEKPLGVLMFSSFACVIAIIGLIRTLKFMRFI